ncbi:MAG: pro-sigmaK processing inhibitor BofA family protein [Eubacteriales bacterium]|nr:pro-sigmaK processing inhibitor BofA family protein [Eubacteriales bacterium]
MEKILVPLIPALLSLALVRLMLLPMKWMLKAAIHGAAGLACLWLLNSIAGFTGIYFPVNAITVLTTGTLGLPGIGVVALLAVL